MKLKLLTQKIIKMDLVLRYYSRSALAENNVYFGQMPILDYISEHEGCSQVEVADFLSLSPAAVALTAKRLVKSGLITKTSYENNMRYKHLHLTELGKKTRELSNKILDEKDKQMFSGFSESELETLSGYIDRLTLNLTEESENKVSDAVFHSLQSKLDKLKK